MDQPPSEISGSYTLRIFRYDAAGDARPRFDAFTVEAGPGTTVLDALFRVQREQDPSLAFRYSCRGAVCGSCGMAINGRLDLACRVQLATLGTREVVLEPLPNLDVLRDLVVDMDPFWDAYERVRPWLHEKAEAEVRESRVSPKERGRIDQFVNCILCACCYAACPVAGREEGYLGPAALAKLARFIEDVRDGRPAEQLDDVDSGLAAWGCDMVFRCRDACPKDVRPADGVAAVRRRLVKGKLTRPFRRRGRDAPACRAVRLSACGHAQAGGAGREAAR